MSEILNLADATPRFALPLLHASQAHKEIFVNEGLLLADALLHCKVLGEADAPPESYEENDCWVVSASPTEAWAGHAGAIAVSRAGTWTFVPPRDGMRVFDSSRGAEMLFFHGWRKPSAPVEPLGGMSVDGEARTAINDLVSALQALGILPLV